MAANSQSSSNMSERNEIVRTNTTQAAFSGALPVIGSGVALIAMLTIGTITIAGAMMGAMPGY